MHFLDIYRKLFLAVVVMFGLFSELSSAIPVDASEIVEESAIEVHEATHLASRKSARGGWATYYNTEEGRGACGKYNHNREHVVAIGKPLWDSTQGNGTSTLCGKSATVKWRGKSVRVRVVDECPVCGYGDIDLSPSAFQKLADKEVGKLNGVVLKFD